ncbi:ketopantoate reductase family protein [Formosa undariae]|uniref:2-dehydropantoate 2-reductase n=1 Tax=Formosa undariae TaxID=1325436 RepID=A0ABV5F0X5_9FLAO
MSKKKILIAGIGGIGGYFGGLLAKAYYDSNEVDIFFLARGNNLTKIQESGLRINDNEVESIVKPNLISDNVSDFGIVDYILICTKTYDLKETVIQLLPAINDDTIIIPLQNGVDSKDKISKQLPKNRTAKGCVYLVSRLEAPGLIIKRGHVHSLFFGMDTGGNEKLQFLQNALLKSNIKSNLSKDINKITWEKFIFLSSIATATAYFDTEIGTILKSKEKSDLLISLINEVTNLAISKQINIDKNQEELVIEKLKSLPDDATTSMHSDFRNRKKNTELESLTGYVVAEGRQNNINIETFNKMYRKLSVRHY